MFTYFMVVAVPASRSQAYKADVALLLQGKADSKDLDSVAAVVRSKVGVGALARDIVDFRPPRVGQCLLMIGRKLFFV